ncbi:hypothetical protein CR513_01653, partial [Mucuna pruriens]
MALVAHFDLELHQMDVKTMFLNGNINKTIYMMQPENFVSNESKSMASRQWYHKFHQVITSNGFEANVVDDCVYYKFSGSKYIFLMLYVDDIPLASSDTGLLYETKRFLTKNFKMKDLGEASFVLGIQILRDRSQGVLGKYLSDLGMQHWKAVKRVMRYLRRIKRHMLTYQKSKDLEIIGYSDYDFAGCQDSKRFSFGYVYMLTGGAISWNPFNHGCRVCGLLQGIQPWDMVRNFVTSLWVVDGIERPLKLYCDNNSTVLYFNNKRSSTKSKFIDIKFLVVKERVQNKKISVEHIGTSFILADSLTKALIPKK